MKRILSFIIALCPSVTLLHAGVKPEVGTDKVLLIEAESFSEKGGWCVDQQFMDRMDSPYLIAHGMGRPVADAVTTVGIPTAGEWRIYVRTYNWTSPWSDRQGPGQFRIKIGGRTLKTVLGATGDDWMWQYAGSVRLKAGETTLALSDLTGFDGRFVP